MAQEAPADGKICRTGPIYQIPEAVKADNLSMLLGSAGRFFTRKKSRNSIIWHSAASQNPAEMDGAGDTALGKCLNSDA